MPALGFHAAWDFDDDGHAITNPEATQMLYSMYPAPVKTLDQPARRIDTAHDFSARQGTDEHVRPCYLDARASSPRADVASGSRVKISMT